MYKYVLECAGDDIWTTERLEQLMELLGEAQIRVVSYQRIVLTGNFSVQDVQKALVATIGDQHGILFCDSEIAEGNSEMLAAIKELESHP